MAYYRAMGDPSWLSTLWGAIKPVVGGIIGGAIGGMPMGPQAATPPIMGPPKPQFPVGWAGGQGGGVVGNVTFPGGLGISGGVMVPGQGRLPPFTATGPGVLPAGGRGGTLIPAGYHLDKRTGTKLVRNRRMNVANPRALRRSMRRVQGFEKLAKRTIQFTRRVKIKKKVC